MGNRKAQVLFRNWKILRGDKVMVMAGRDNGLTGTVRCVFRRKNTVLVEGRNLVKKHIKRTKDSPGGVITKEAPVHVSNLQLLDPVSGSPVRVKAGYLEDGTKVRVSVGKLATASVIPRPAILATSRKPRDDGGPKNTLKDEVLERTYDAATGMGIHPSRNFFLMYDRKSFPRLPHFPPREGPRAYETYRNLNQATPRLPYTPSKKERRAARAANQQS